MINLSHIDVENLSIDTVRVCLNIPNAEELFLKRSFFQKIDPGQSSGSERETLYFWGASEFDSLPSSWTPPALFISGEKVFIQFSLPKILYGHSARLATIDQLIPALYALAEVMARDWDIPIVLEPELWQINRIDCSYNLDCGSRSAAEKVMSQLSRLRSPWGNLGYAHKRDRLPYWPSRSRTFKFYLKLDEMLKNASDYGGEQFVKSIPGLDSVIRYEEEWHQQYLVRFLNLSGEGSSSKVTAQRVVQAIKSKRKPARFFELLDRQFIKKGTVMGITAAKSKIRAEIPRYNQMLDYLDSIIDFGMEHTRLNMFPGPSGRQKFYRYNKKLFEIGINPASFDPIIDDPFNRDSFSVTDNIDSFYCSADDITLIGDELVKKIRHYFNKTLSNTHFHVV